MLTQLVMCQVKEYITLSCRHLVLRPPQATHSNFIRFLPGAVSVYVPKRVLFFPPFYTEALTRVCMCTFKYFGDLSVSGSIL